MKTQFQGQQFDNMNNDPDNYKWGLFYWNPKDNRVFVPKRIRQFGWTLNFANPVSYFIILGILLFGYIMSSIFG